MHCALFGGATASAGSGSFSAASVRSAIITTPSRRSGQPILKTGPTSWNWRRRVRLLRLEHTLQRTTEIGLRLGNTGSLAPFENYSKKTF